ncbi:MAG: Re/Si-specific NAD(P)(+) transhydrogenase subunit alpha [Deltaproteobacteria bacterium]|jgi:NAD(P) transhydrogenase subunit alpha|nr:Re/Si-specific NAD(P)(+) transhydrogenase subunit alpha [Deltaproteobacteria bacterium]
MNIVVPSETHPAENRVALLPEHVARLVEKGAQISVESGIGKTLNISDDDYQKAGASIEADRSQLYQNADMVLQIRKPAMEDVALLKKESIYVSLMDPFNERELIEAFRQKDVTAISMEMIPRITRAQKMDVLSSQANLAGYAAVIIAAERIDKIFPMMMTPAGTISPARVFVVGVGVAGLQAIATAKRLGARVEAFDTRPVVEEQVKSLGARFVKIDLGETGQTKDGYAKALTEEQLQKQREGMSKVCAASDVVITTAQLFGRKAPLIITAEMVAGMAKGSVLVDLAVESGGNIAGSQPDQEVDVNGVRIIGLANLPGKVAVNASQMFSSNMHALVDEFWNAEEKRFVLDFEDEILQGCVITHQGKVVNQMIADHYVQEANMG